MNTWNVDDLNTLLLRKRHRCETWMYFVKLHNQILWSTCNNLWMFSEGAVSSLVHRCANLRYQATIATSVWNLLHVVWHREFWGGTLVFRKLCWYIEYICLNSVHTCVSMAGVPNHSHNSHPPNFWQVVGTGVTWGEQVSQVIGPPLAIHFLGSF